LNIATTGEWNIRVAKNINLKHSKLGEEEADNKRSGRINYDLNIDLGTV
jgi:hypothetical protein